MELIVTLLAIVLGAFGVHRMIKGDPVWGAVLLVLAVLLVVVA